MSFSIGIVGLPNAGKSTLFSVLTKKQVAIAPHIFTTIEPNIAKVPVPDQRLNLLSEVLRPQKTLPAQIEFIDIAGLVRGAHQGRGLGNQFLSHIMTCRAILHVVRAFEDKTVQHTEDRIDPVADIEIINKEFEMKDQELLERHKTKNVRPGLTFPLLSKKPQILVLNTSGSEKTGLLQKIKKSFPAWPVLAVDLKLEKELESLDPKEIEELKISSRLDQIITVSYNQLGLITFYTIAGSKEISSRTLQKGQTILEAAQKIHSDFKEQFKKAEVLPFEDFAKVKSWQKAKAQGLIKIAGKDYQVRDGDIIEIKI